MNLIDDKIIFLPQKYRLEDKKYLLETISGLRIEKTTNNWNYYRYDIKIKRALYSFKFEGINADFDEFTVGLFDFKNYRIIKYFTFSTKYDFTFNFVAGEDIEDVALCIYAGKHGDTKNKTIYFDNIVIFKKKLSYNDIEYLENGSSYNDNFDIDDSLDEIIIKYNIDEFYPRYRQVKKAEKLIRLMADKWGCDEKVVFISIGDKEYNKGRHYRNQRHIYRMLNEKQRGQVTFIQCERKGAEAEVIKLYNKELYDYSKLEKVVWKEYDRVYIVSNNGDNFVGQWLREHNVEYVSIYDYFALNGLVDFSHNKLSFFDFLIDKSETCFNVHSYMLDPITYEFHEQKCKYELHKNNIKWADFFLKKMIFLLLVLRNVYEAQKYIILLECNDKDSIRYHEALREVKKLVQEIKRRLHERTQNDIMALWVDATSILQVESMPYLSSLKDKSIWFENLVSMNPHTHEVLKAIFLRKKLIDDNTDAIKTITTYNSILLSDLEQNNYLMKNIGDMYFTDDYLTDIEAEYYVASSNRLWESIRQILRSKKPCFILTHVDMETHEPNLSTIMKDDELANLSERVKAGIIEADNQIKFYTNLLGPNAVSMIFSDHGREEFWPRLRIFMSIYSPKYMPVKINGLCSNYDFYKIIHAIINGERMPETTIRRDWVGIQGNNIRNGSFEAIIHSRRFPRNARPSLVKSCWGFSGVVTKDYVYIFFSNGREFLFPNKKEVLHTQWYPRAEDCCNSELLPYFRDLAKTKNGISMEMIETDYYKELCKVYQTALPRNMKKIEGIRNIVSMEDKVVIYGGGIASKEFYYALDLDQRKKVVGFIDADIKCACESIGLPVFHSYENDESTIIVTQRGLLPEIYGKYHNTTNVVGVYEYFDGNGIDCKTDFWDFELRKEDF